MVTMPDIKTALLAEEQQAQWDTNNLVKALEEANHKHEELANKRRESQDAQATRKKCEVEQREADVKVRGKLLANAVVAEVWCRVMRQADKARLAVSRIITASILHFKEHTTYCLRLSTATST